MLRVARRLGVRTICFQAAVHSHLCARGVSYYKPSKLALSRASAPASAIHHRMIAAGLLRVVEHGGIVEELLGRP